MQQIVQQVLLPYKGQVLLPYKVVKSWTINLSVEFHSIEEHCDRVEEKMTSYCKHECVCNCVCHV